MWVPTTLPAGLVRSLARSPWRLGLVVRVLWGRGEKRMLIVLQVRDEDGAFGEPPCAPPPRSGPGRPPKPTGCEGPGMRELARRLPGAHLAGAKLSGREPSSVGAVADGMTAGVAVFYSWKRKQDQS